MGACASRGGRATRRLVAGVLSVGVSLFSAGAQDVRLFFDKTPTHDNGDLSEHAGVLAFENPVVVPEERLYIYFEFQYESSYEIVEFGVNAEEGVITRAHMFNGVGQIVNPPMERWDGAFPNPVQSPGESNVTFGGGSASRFGLLNDFRADLRDVLQFRRPDRDGGSVDGTTLLGFVDVAPLPGAERSEVFFSVGGFGRGTPVDWVALGFGDDPVPNLPGQRSALPDAIVEPEPGGLALLALGLLLAARRR